MSDEEFQDAMQQVEYDSSLHGAELQNHDFAGKVSMAVKKYCPFILLSYDQMTRKSFTDIKDAFWHADSGKIYHEPLTTEELKSAKCENNERVVWLEKACQENDICFINMKQDFLEEYLYSNSLPYGFYNTEMGSGHLNKTGHRIIAKRLLEELKESKDEYLNI